MPVLSQGGNTILCGGAVPSESGPAPVILSLTRMRAIRAIDPVNNTMEVEAGCVLATMQEAAAPARRSTPSCRPYLGLDGAAALPADRRLARLCPLPGGVPQLLAAGATAVLLGRAPLFGLASGGQQGAERALAILGDELDRTMALLGCRTVADLRGCRIA